MLKNRDSRDIRFVFLTAVEVNLLDFGDECDQMRPLLILFTD